MTTILPEQAAALRQLKEVCYEIGVDVVVIGAVAYRVWLDDENRMTEDVDVAVALDVDELPQLTDRLAIRGWRQDARWEQRWHSLGNARVDVLPVGPKARQRREIVWPRAETRMRVVGYDHVFHDAVERELAPDLVLRVVPLPVLALLKIVSYSDDPHARQKDLRDLVALMRSYEEDGERRFSDEVLDVGVDYQESGAYLLGRDLRALCTGEDEEDAVDRFLERVCNADFHVPVAIGGVGSGDANRPYARGFAALARGFGPVGSTR